MIDFDLGDSDLLDRHEPAWRARGYDVIRNPQRMNLPQFLAGYEPDVVLLGRTPKVVVEVVRKGQPQVERKVRQLKALLEGHDDWRLELLYAGVQPDDLPPMADDRLRQALTSVRDLAPIEARGAILLFWATLEALARRLEPTETTRPQTPGRVVELLAGSGFVTPSEAADLRESARSRNRLVHGDLEATLPVGQILGLVEIAEGLMRLVEDPQANPSDGSA